MISKSFNKIYIHKHTFYISSLEWATPPAVWRYHQTIYNIHYRAWEEIHFAVNLLKISDSVSKSDIIIAIFISLHVVWMCVCWCTNSLQFNYQLNLHVQGMKPIGDMSNFKLEIVLGDFIDSRCYRFSVA